MIKGEDFEEIDLGIYECETKLIVWGNKADILVTYMDTKVCANKECAYYELTQCANWSNMCLEWIEEHQESIQKIILKDSRFQLECSFGTDTKHFFDQLCLKKVEIVVDANGEISRELCMYIDAKPFVLPEHCHCIEAALLEKENGTYEVDVIEDMQQLLLEIRDASKDGVVEVCEWAKKSGIYYAFDDEWNMLAVVEQQFGLSKDKKLVAKTDEKTKRNAIYFIPAEWETEELQACAREGLPMPFGFVIKDLTCEQGVFTITSSSGHEAVLGAFFVMMEALRVMEMLYWSRGVTEEEIEKCYYAYLVEDHQKYLKNKNE